MRPPEEPAELSEPPAFARQSPSRIAGEQVSCGQALVELANESPTNWPSMPSSDCDSGEVDLLVRIMDSMGHDSGGAGRRQFWSRSQLMTSRHGRLAVVDKLEAFIAANYDRPLYLAEICAATGVSERTLRLCCEKHLGMSPIRYLWLHRMRLARQVLRDASPKRQASPQSQPMMVSVSLAGSRLAITRCSARRRLPRCVIARRLRPK
jgi:AraC-like DNA-binding protein